MRLNRWMMAALGVALWLAPARAATPEQAERARACQVPETMIAHSIAKEPILSRFEHEIRHVGRGAGDIQIIEFFDYSCPACRALRPTLIDLTNAYPDVRVDLVDYPVYADTLVSKVTGNKTLDASLIGLAAIEQGEAKYLAFHDALFSTKGRVSEAAIRGAAAQAGLDLARAEARSQTKDLRAQAARHVAYAKSLGVSGTPGLVVEGVILNGGYMPSVVTCLIQGARKAL